MKLFFGKVIQNPEKSTANIQTSKSGITFKVKHVHGKLQLSNFKPEGRSQIFYIFSRKILKE
jgi:hypothetical protein